VLQTVAPILSIGSASLVAISTLTSEINFYTRLIKMVDPDTDRPLFQTRCIELACEACIADGKGHECVHLLHLVPQWQSAERHRKLRVMMQDRPDLIQSELAGLAFDSLQQVFRKGDIKIAVSIEPLPFVDHQTVFLTIDPVMNRANCDVAMSLNDNGALRRRRAGRKATTRSCRSCASVGRSRSSASTF
jgi:hypothetical protein